MSEDEKVYEADEIALILRKAAELARSCKVDAGSSSGLSLEEIKAVGAEVGFDPSLIERAARLIPQRAEQSILERLIGGPFQHRREVRTSTKLTAETSANLLSTVRTTMEDPGQGQSDASGMSWRASAGVVSVTTNTETGGTRVRVRIDRRASLVVITLLSLTVSLILASVAVDEAGSMLGLALAALLPAALGRSIWAYGARRAREKVEALVDAVGRSLAETSQSAPSADSD